MKYAPAEYAKYLLSLHSETPKKQKEGVNSLVKLLEKNGDLRDWRKIEEVYESLREQSAVKKGAVVSYAGHIPKTEIKNHLKKYEVEFNENESLIGGMQIKIGDIRIDNSIAGRLAEIKRALA